MAGSDKSAAAHHVSRILHVLLVLALLTLIGVQVYGRFVVPLVSHELAADTSKELTPTDTAKLHQTGERALENRDWQTMIEIYGRLVEISPDDSRAWVCLAYAYQQDNRWEEAIRANLRCCEFSQVKPWALFQLARAYAIRGNQRFALDYLRESLNSGFRPSKSLAQEPHFVSLLEHDEFLELADSTRPLAELSVYRQLDFLDGAWDVLDGNGQRIGGLEIEQQADGYAICGIFRGDGDESATIQYFYDPSSDLWTRIRIDSEGDVETCRGRMRAGTSGISQSPMDDSPPRLLLEGERVSPGGEKRLCKVRITPRRYSRIGEIVEVSDDGGHSWVTEFAGELVRPTALSN